MTTPTAKTDALAFLAGLVRPDGRRWIDGATSVQVADAGAVLDPDSPLRRHWISRARGYSKTEDAGGWSLAAMSHQSLPAGPSVFCAAADADQARLLVDSMAGFVQRSGGGLHGRFEVQTRRVVDLTTGVELVVLAADAASAYGLRPALLFLDELCQWPTTPNARAFFDALWTALPKIAGSRAAIITTSGDPSHWTRKVYEAALAEPDLWRVSETRGPAPWMDARLLAAERRRLLDSTYRRLFENEWCASEDRLVDPDDLAACVTLEGPLGYDPAHQYVVAVDLGVRRDRSVVVVCHAEPRRGCAADGSDASIVGTKVYVDRIEVWSPSRGNAVDLSAVEAWIAQASEGYGRARIVTDPWQAIGMAQRLGARGLHVEEYPFTAASVGRLGATLHLLLRNRSLALPPDEELLDELRAVRLRETTPGVVRLDHDPDRHDDRAVAIGLAATKLLERPEPPDPRELSDVCFEVSPDAWESEEPDLGPTPGLMSYRRCGASDSLWNPERSWDHA